ncbi:hypothetical protein WJX73_008087 [Symbiochloris irregularis]|uniref:Ribosomal protein S21 n=1 Tax=Symbiochloris irregularis TaxID=706552 RepID=A0AAW1Q130_9CHLO
MQSSPLRALRALYTGTLGSIEQLCTQSLCSVQRRQLFSIVQNERDSQAINELNRQLFAEGHPQKLRERSKGYARPALRRKEAAQASHKRISRRRFGYLMSWVMKRKERGF